MLVVTRRQFETINIGDDIVITVTKIDRGQVSIGIDAPRNIPVHRNEIYRKAKRESELSIKGDKE